MDSSGPGRQNSKGLGPKSDLKDLKEEPLPFAYTPKLHKEFDKQRAICSQRRCSTQPLSCAVSMSNRTEAGCGSALALLLTS
jgi:hypothetical protein